MSQFPALHGRESGTLEISRTVLIFSFDDQSKEPITLSTRSLEITLTGNNSVHYLIKDKHIPNSEIIVQDATVLQTLSTLGVESADLALRSSRKKRGIRVFAVSSPFLIALLLIAAIPLLFSWVPVKWLDGMLTHQQERAIGNLLLPALTNSIDSVAVTSNRQDEVTKLVEFLKSHNPDLAKIDFVVKLSSSEDVNAYALPGAIIVVNQGLLSQATSVHEVIGVIAHEIAHVERRHAMKALTGRVGYFGGIMILGFFVGYDAAAAIAKVGDLVSLKYSRADETEADGRGVEFLSNAGISARGMIRFFDELARKQEIDGVSKALALLSTHPLSSDRVANLKNLSEMHPILTENKLPVSMDDLRPKK